MQHIAIFDDIAFALDPHFACILGCNLAAQGDVILIGDGFGADEAALEIAMDHARGLWRGGAVADRPCAGLFRANGELGFQCQKVIARANKAVETCLL